MRSFFPPAAPGRARAGHRRRRDLGRTPRLPGAARGCRVRGAIDVHQLQAVDRGAGATAAPGCPGWRPPPARSWAALPASPALCAGAGCRVRSPLTTCRPSTAAPAQLPHLAVLELATAAGEILGRTPRLPGAARGCRVRGAIDVHQLQAVDRGLRVPTPPQTPRNGALRAHGPVLRTEPCCSPLPAPSLLCCRTPIPLRIRPATSTSFRISGFIACRPCRTSLIKILPFTLSRSTITHSTPMVVSDRTSIGNFRFRTFPKCLTRIAKTHFSCFGVSIFTLKRCIFCTSASTGFDSRTMLIPRRFSCLSTRNFLRLCSRLCVSISIWFASFTIRFSSSFRVCSRFFLGCGGAMTCRV